MMICVLLGQRLGPDTDKKFLAIGCCHYDCSTLQFHQTLSSGINCTFIKNCFNSVIRNNLHHIVHTLTKSIGSDGGHGGLDRLKTINY